MVLKEKAYRLGEGPSGEWRVESKIFDGGICSFIEVKFIKSDWEWEGT